jgi:hypothetical protein
MHDFTHKAWNTPHTAKYRELMMDECYRGENRTQKEAKLIDGAAEGGEVEIVEQHGARTLAEAKRIQKHLRAQKVAKDDEFVGLIWNISGGPVAGLLGRRCRRLPAERLTRWMDTSEMGVR